MNISPPESRPEDVLYEPETSAAEQYTVVSETEEDLTDYDEVGWKYAEALARSRRESLQNLTAAMTAGWTREDYAHWVQTGEEPKFEEGAPDVDP